MMTSLAWPTALPAPLHKHLQITKETEINLSVYIRIWSSLSTETAVATDWPEFCTSCL